MKSKSKTKPIYGKEVEGAANTLTGVYNSQAPEISSNAAQFSPIIGESINRWRQGDANINAGRAFNADVLSGKYMGGNPHLEGIIEQTRRGVSDGVNASIGTRGLTGGSSHSGILGRALADAEGRLRFEDHQDEMSRMERAAGMSHIFAGAESDMLNPAFAAYDATMQPLRAAESYAQGVDGILGKYTKTKQSPGIGGLIGAGLSGWASGGFRI